MILIIIIIGNEVAYAEGSVIRHVNCAIIMMNGRNNKCCDKCKQYRNNSLLKQLNRMSKFLDNEQCSTSSHTNYRFLSSDQKNERLKRLHAELRNKVRQLNTIQDSIQRMFENDGIPLDFGDDFTVLMKKYTPLIESTHKKDSFQYLFWKQQLNAMTMANPKSVRWHPLVIKWCLYLHHKSSGAYKTLRESGILKLPSERTLRDYRHFAPAKAGFSKSYDQQLLDLVKAKPSKDLAKYIVILVDEMYVKEGLVYDKCTGALTGFVELGDVDSHLNQCEQSSMKSLRALAKTIVVFMVSGVVSSLVFPYAVYPVRSLKACNLFPLLWEVIGRLSRHGFRVLGVTCDGASSNRKMFQMHDSTNSAVYKTINVYSSDRHPIFFISDPPHLLKTIRNCFANSKRHLWVSV